MFPGLLLLGLTVRDHTEVSFHCRARTELVQHKRYSTEVYFFKQSGNILPFVHLANELNDIHHADLLLLVSYRAWTFMQANNETLTFITRQL